MPTLPHTHTLLRPSSSRSDSRPRHGKQVSIVIFARHCRTNVNRFYNTADSAIFFFVTAALPQGIKMQAAPAMLLKRCMVLSKGCMQQMAATSSIVQSSSISSISNSQHQHSSAASNTQKALMLAANKTLTAGFASSSEVANIPEGQNSWSKFRAPYGQELKSSLGPAMYISIAIFGFSLYLNDLIYHPPRVVTMFALMGLLLYVRRK